MNIFFGIIVISLILDYILYPEEFFRFNLLLKDIIEAILVFSFGLFLFYRGKITGVKNEIQRRR